MPTYTIVDKDQSPLGPNEINAGSAISVSDGDVFIIDASANANITFQSSGGSVDFDVVVNDPNANGFEFKVEADLSLTFSIADNVTMPSVKLDAKAADDLTLNIGNSVSFGQLDGAVSGPNTITVGDDFVTDKGWKLGDADDVVTFGDSATIKDIDAGLGNDDIWFGDNANVNNIDTKEGSDTIRFGDDAVFNDLKAGDGDDQIILGKNASGNSVDGENGNDTLTTQTPGTNTKNLETETVVCFVQGTLIETERGPIAVEDLQVRDTVRTSDHGSQPITWIGRFGISGISMQRTPNLRPIRIAAGSLGHGLPQRDLIVSPQHRILLRSRIARRMFGTAEILVAAKKLVGWPGIRVCDGHQGITYYHLLLNRHEVVFAEGAETESMYLGPQARATLGASPANSANGPPLTGVSHHGMSLARLVPQNARAVQQFLKRHLQNGQPLVSRCVQGRVRRHLTTETRAAAPVG